MPFDQTQVCVTSTTAKMQNFSVPSKELPPATSSYRHHASPPPHPTLPLATANLFSASTVLSFGEAYRNMIINSMKPIY